MCGVARLTNNSSCDDKMSLASRYHGGDGRVDSVLWTVVDC